MVSLLSNLLCMMLWCRVLGYAFKTLLVGSRDRFRPVVQVDRYYRPSRGRVREEKQFLKQNVSYLKYFRFAKMYTVTSSGLSSEMCNDFCRQRHVFPMSLCCVCCCYAKYTKQVQSVQLRSCQHPLTQTFQGSPRAVTCIHCFVFNYILK